MEISKATLHRIVTLTIMQCRYFHVCDGSLLPDIMHDLLEGALQYETKLLLKSLITEEKLFTLGMYAQYPA